MLKYVAPSSFFFFFCPGVRPSSTARTPVLPCRLVQSSSTSSQLSSLVVGVSGSHHPPAPFFLILFTPEQFDKAKGLPIGLYTTVPGILLDRYWTIIVVVFVADVFLYYYFFSWFLNESCDCLLGAIFEPLQTLKDYFETTPPFLDEKKEPEPGNPQSYSSKMHTLIVQ